MRLHWKGSPLIFWTLTALTVILAAYIFYREWRDGYGMPFMGAFVTLLGGTVATWIVVALCSLIPANIDLVSDETYKLKAIGNNSAIEGRLYFLGGGYIDDKRVLNYISQRPDGAIHVEQTEAEDATIFEGTDEATVRVRHYDFNNGWIITWPLGSSDRYEFRIPTGSVVESYTLNNG